MCKPKNNHCCLFANPLHPPHPPSSSPLTQFILSCVKLIICNFRILIFKECHTFFIEILFLEVRCISRHLLSPLLLFVYFLALPTLLTSSTYLIAFYCTCTSCACPSYFSPLCTQSSSHMHEYLCTYDFQVSSIMAHQSISHSHVCMTCRVRAQVARELHKINIICGRSVW